MAKSKLVKANEKIAEGVVGGYKKIEEGVVGGYKKIEEGAAGRRMECTQRRHYYGSTFTVTLPVAGMYENREVYIHG